MAGQQWTCTREQMADAVANLKVRVLTSGPAAGLIVAEDFTDAILGQLPQVAAGDVTVSRADLELVLERAEPMFRAAGGSGDAYDRLAAAAGLS
jgi:hypothetical protein